MSHILTGEGCAVKQRMIGFLLLFCLLMSGCGQRTGPYYWSQDITGLRELLHAPAQETTAPAEEQPPQEITQIRAVWIPVMQYAEWMTGKTEAEFRDQVRAAFRACAALGLNCVFLHVRAYGDAYYDSDLFPHGSYLTGSYDPLAIMAAEAHQAGLEAHAWINPLRLKTPENMAQIPDTYLLRQWYDDPEKNGTYMKLLDAGNGGEIFVFDMGQPVKIADLARRMIKMSGAKDIEIKFTGLRDGEKLYEEVLNDKEITLPTFHEKIKIAKVREYDYAEVNKRIIDIIVKSTHSDDMSIVASMKELVPEFKSQHSKYEALDKK